MKIELVDTVKFPAYALSYLINGDASGIEDEDVENVDAWLESLSEYGPYQHFTFDYGDYEEDFYPHPEFGLACECVELKIYAERLDTD